MFLHYRQLRWDLNPVDCRVWEILQKKVYKIRFTVLGESKQQLSPEWTKLDYVVIAAAIHQWRR